MRDSLISVFVAVVIIFAVGSTDCAKCAAVWGLVLLLFLTFATLLLLLVGIGGGKVDLVFRIS
jgi:hypothetical protein